MSIIELPFTLIDSVPIVKATIDGDIRNFLFDTGAQDIILNAKYEDLTDKSPCGKTIGISGRMNHTYSTIISEMYIGSLLVQNQNAIIREFNSPSDKSASKPTYEIMGYEAIKNYDILFDHNKKKIFLIAPQLSKQYMTRKSVVMPFVFYKHGGHLPVIPITIKNKVFNVIIDSGANHNTFDKRNFEYLKKLSLVNFDEPFALAENDDHPAQISILKSPINIFKNIKHRNLFITFTDLSVINQHSEIRIDGILGYPFLSRQKTLISYKRKEIILERNTRNYIGL